METKGPTASGEMEDDSRIAARAAGHIYDPSGFGLADTHRLLERLLEMARERASKDPADPGRVVLAEYGRRILEIVEPGMVDGNQ